MAMQQPIVAVPHTTGIACSSFKDLEALSKELSDGLLFDEGTSDVVLIVQGDRLPAHRAILAARSPVFKPMFFGSMRESSAQEVEVSTFAAATMRLLLRFMYAGAIESQSGACQCSSP